MRAGDEVHVLDGGLVRPKGGGVMGVGGLEDEDDEDEGPEEG